MWGGPGAGLGLFAICHVDSALGIKPEDMGDLDLDQGVGWVQGKGEGCEVCLIRMLTLMISSLEIFQYILQ